MILKTSVFHHSFRNLRIFVNKPAFAVVSKHFVACRSDIYLFFFRIYRNKWDKQIFAGTFSLLIYCE